MTIIVTGGAGFIGAGFVYYMLEKYPDYRIVCVDCLTYAGNLSTLREALENPNFRFCKVNICDREAVYDLFEEERPEMVINFAAESHVDRSIVDPEVFLTTNIIGTQVLLDAAKRHWNLRSDDPCSREYRADVRYLQISTDEVYGSLKDDGYFTETSPIKPSSPYSASKAGSDFVALSYRETFKIRR